MEILREKTNSSLIGRDGSTLVVIDVQDKLMPVIARREEVVKNIVKLIKFCKVCGIPIVLTEQYPKGLGRTIKEIKDELQGIKPIEKTSFSCFGSKEFKDALKRSRAKTLLLVGIEAHVCVAQTAIEALERFKVCVVADAVSSRTSENAQVGLQRMRDSGAIISSTEMLMYELLRDSRAREFKEVKQLLK
jgi:nicotinamidase-related amidase